MAANPLRSPNSDPREPVVYDLPPVRFDSSLIAIRLTVRWAEDRMWRGRLTFVDGTTGVQRESAEIFCGASAQDLWQSVLDLRDHHWRDLYRSLL
jgi:hypothetical protein